MQNRSNISIVFCLIVLILLFDGCTKPKGFFTPYRKEVKDTELTGGNLKEWDVQELYITVKRYNPDLNMFYYEPTFSVNQKAGMKLTFYADGRLAASDSAGLFLGVKTGDTWQNLKPDSDGFIRSLRMGEAGFYDIFRYYFPTPDMNENLLMNGSYTDSLRSVYSISMILSFK